MHALLVSDFCKAYFPAGDWVLVVLCVLTRPVHRVRSIHLDTPVGRWMYLAPSWGPS